MVQRNSYLNAGSSINQQSNSQLNSEPKNASNFSSLIRVSSITNNNSSTLQQKQSQNENTASHLPDINKFSRPSSKQHTTKKLLGNNAQSHESGKSSQIGVNNTNLNNMNQNLTMQQFPTYQQYYATSSASSSHQQLQNQTAQLMVQNSNIINNSNNVQQSNGYVLVQQQQLNFAQNNQTQQFAVQHRMPPRPQNQSNSNGRSIQINVVGGSIKHESQKANQLINSKDIARLPYTPYQKKRIDVYKQQQQFLNDQLPDNVIQTMSGEFSSLRENNNQNGKGSTNINQFKQQNLYQERMNIGQELTRTLPQRASGLGLTQFNQNQNQNQNNNRINKNSSTNDNYDLLLAQQQQQMINNFNRTQRMGGAGGTQQYAKQSVESLNQQSPPQMNQVQQNGCQNQQPPLLQVNQFNSYPQNQNKNFNQNQVLIDGQVLATTGFFQSTSKQLPKQQHSSITANQDPSYSGQPPKIKKSNKNQTAAFIGNNATVKNINFNQQLPLPPSAPINKLIKPILADTLHNSQQTQQLQNSQINQNNAQQNIQKRENIFKNSLMISKIDSAQANNLVIVQKPIKRITFSEKNQIQQNRRQLNSQDKKRGAGPGAGGSLNRSQENPYFIVQGQNHHQHTQSHQNQQDQFTSQAQNSYKQRNQALSSQNSQQKRLQPDFITTSITSTGAQDRQSLQNRVGQEDQINDLEQIATEVNNQELKSHREQNPMFQSLEIHQKQRNMLGTSHFEERKRSHQQDNFSNLFHHEDQIELQTEKSNQQEIENPFPQSKLIEDYYHIVNQEQQANLNSNSQGVNQSNKMTSQSLNLQNMKKFENQQDNNSTQHLAQMSLDFENSNQVYIGPDHQRPRSSHSENVQFNRNDSFVNQDQNSTITVEIQGPPENISGNYLITSQAAHQETVSSSKKGNQNATGLVGQLGGIEEVDSQDFDDEEEEECDDESDDDNIDFNNRANNIDNPFHDGDEEEQMDGDALSQGNEGHNSDDNEDNNDNQMLGDNDHDQEDNDNDNESDLDKENEDEFLNSGDNEEGKGMATSKMTVSKKNDKQSKDGKSTSKKDKKDKNKKKGQKDAVNAGGAAAMLNPQIKITISNKKGKEGGEIKNKSINQKQSQNSNNPQAVNFLATPNQNTKGKAAKLSNTQTITSNGKSNSNQNSQQKKKKGNKSVALIHSLPRNLEEESIKFFESNCTYNPIFEYENPNLAQKYLLEFKEPNDELMQISKKILESFLAHYGSESSYLLTEGLILTQEQTEKYFMDYLEALGVADQVTLSFQKNKIAPTSVTHDPKTGRSKINIGLPIEYREGRIMGVLHHEVGTHFLRKYNEKLQVWYKKREKYELKSCIQTEEGFATINQYFEMSQENWKKPFLYKAALNYYSAYMASKMSFVELFNDLEKYIDNPRRRWKCTLRVKRGMINTEEPGGLYKDQVYLEGVVQVLKERQTLDFVALYCGKLSLEDLKKPIIEKRIKKEGILLPTFMSNMVDYMKALDVIAKTNFID